MNTARHRARGLQRWVAALLLGLFVQFAHAVDTEHEFSDPVLQARYEKLIHELRCLQCQNNTIADSPAGIASDLRREVHAMIKAGKSDAEILGFLTTRYGDFVLYRPPFAPRTWLLWLAPVLLIGIGGIVAYRIVTRRTQLMDADSTDDDLDDETTRKSSGSAHGGTQNS